MGSKYRVIVMREGAAEDETLFEIAGSADLVQSIVPGVLDVVLREPVAGSDTAGAVFDGAVAAGVTAGALPAGTTSSPIFADAPKPQRKRRSKVEIAADEAAKALGFRDAAHRAEAEASQPVHPGGPDPQAAPAQPVAVPDDVIVPEQASPAQPAAAPYNPFAVTG